MKARVSAVLASCAILGGVAAVPLASAEPVNASAPVNGVATSNDIARNLPVKGTVTVTDVTNGVVTGVFNGTIGGVPVTNEPVTGLLPQQNGNTCQVLHLTLGPLDLNLLGLRIQLNQIDLRITAQRGGGLLGDLLCGLAGG